jgi:hypothetical protein
MCPQELVRQHNLQYLSGILTDGAEVANPSSERNTACVRSSIELHEESPIAMDYIASSPSDGVELGGE